MSRLSCRKFSQLRIVLILVVYVTLYKINFDGDPPVVSPYWSEHCNCNKTIRSGNLNSDYSVDYCSAISTARGDHQNVVAYSLYGTAYSDQKLTRYFSLFEVLPEQIRYFYPGWIMRVYHNIDQSQSREHLLLCHMYCHNDNVDLCDVNHLAERWKGHPSSLFGLDLIKLNPRKWRYLALLDPQIDGFMARDIDSEINTREQTAVDQWLHSNYTFHVMRDHQSHSYAIMAGMFGAKVGQRRDVIQSLTRALVTLGTGRQHFLDQILLAKVFWPTVKDDAVIHDSYFCEQKLGGVRSRPFPTQRVNQSFVSDRTGSSWLRPDPCPLACRPADHLDWRFC